MEKIGAVKEKFASCPVGELKSLLAFYREDARSGVQAECKKAQRRLQALETEKERTWQMKRYEREYQSLGYICGIDEAGRGPLAGPVVAGAVILPPDCGILYINDSKQLSAKKREELYAVILREALSVGVGMVEPARIDQINILQATYEAMREAVKKLDPVPDILLNDAVTIPGIAIRQVPIVKGDQKSMSIAAASIVAKVTRDRMMEEYDRQYPGYGFLAHKGYGAAAHVEALRKYGPTPIHRRSFLKNILQEGLDE